MSDMTIRRATPADGAALRRLAALDSAPPLGPDALVALVDGEPWAAVSLTGDRAIADPFRPAAELVDLLRLRSAQLRAPDEQRRRRGSRLRARGATAGA